jgi:LPS-assembly protein
LAAFPARAQEVRVPSHKGGIVEIYSTGPQKKQGDLFIVEDNVDIRYAGSRLRADHVEYNDETSDSFARGHVQFDFENQHLEADEAHLNVNTGRGTFKIVRGTVKIERTPNPALLLSNNPLYFEAQEVDRLSADVYVVRHAWITICDPEHPQWQFFAARARIRLDKTVALVNANFRLLRVPLIWLPYATAPAGKKVRETGFLIPDAGQSSRKGFILGDAFYWAPTSWLDTTLGAQYMSRRGALERGEFRAKPFENTSIDYTYFGVDDRGLLISPGVRQAQGGEQQRLEIKSNLPGGWRFVTDFNQLSSLTFRLAFADTFGEATNSEVRSSIFLTNNFHGFSLNFAGLNDKTFLSLPSTLTVGTVTTTTPAISVNTRNAPEVRFGSVEQAPWQNLPIYFGFDAFAGAVHRTDPNIDTPSFVSRTEFAPRVTIPIHFGAWLGITTSAAFRTTRYGDALDAAGDVTGRGIVRNTGEFTIDLRPPTLERYFDRQPADKSKPHRRYKHTIEPTLTYRYVTGVNDFADFIRFDSDATLTDTNEIEYGVTQRFYLKSGDDQPQELISWSILQKHYFDPTFGGAIEPGERNVFQALNSITPFAFALGPVNWSPIVSDVKITPGGIYDAEQILEYSPNFQKLTTIGTLFKVKPYKEFFATVAHFRVSADPILQPVSHQIRTLVGYGAQNRKGFNITTGVSYDITHNTLQSQLVQATYNGGCCGLSVEYLRINIADVRTENQFKVALVIANIGNFGNLRRAEKIF